MTREKPGQSPPLAGLLRSGLRLALIFAAIWLAHRAATELTAATGGAARLPLGLIVVLLVAYGVLIAVPFVPGVEIGLALLLIEGGRIAPFVYLATVSGLMLAYLAGAHLPYPRLYGLLADLRLHRVCRLLDRVAKMNRAERLALLQDRLPGWVGRRAISQRHILLGLLVNMPGNAVIGGGGGILLLAGLSGLFAARWVAVTLAVAVAPVPLLVWLFDLRLPL